MGSFQSVGSLFVDLFMQIPRYSLIPDSTPRLGHQWPTGAGGCHRWATSGPPITLVACYLGYNNALAAVYSPCSSV